MSLQQKLQAASLRVEAANESAEELLKILASKLSVRVKPVVIEPGREVFGILLTGVVAPRLSKAKAALSSVSDLIQVHGREDMVSGGGFVVRLTLSNGQDTFVASYSPDTRTISIIRQ